MDNITKKMLGAFYTPEILADLLSKRMLNLAIENGLKELYVLDPAIGEGNLVKSLIKVAKENKDINLDIAGIDINIDAIRESQKATDSKDNSIKYINTDALYPFGKDHIEGWRLLKDKYYTNGINFIVSNPPWGVDLSGYIDVKKDFVSAKGQYDIYDLFIETIIDNLSEDGIYGIIVPDSIYNQEHLSIRKKLLEETSIDYIYRLGETFFGEVNTSISIIIGSKNKANKKHVVSCFHLASIDRKRASEDFAFLDKISEEDANNILQSQMLSSNYSFLLDIQEKDNTLFNLFNNAKIHLNDFAKSVRGAEISKKGLVVKCPYCGKWLPFPNLKKGKKYNCPNCKKEIDFTKAERKRIISNTSDKNNKGIIVGEDIYRYVTKVSKYIELGYTGINYKDEEIYKGSKILVRKTGVGITAGIDYSGSYTNQVVYIVKRKDTCPKYITNEFILAVLCSRAMTYFYIKKYGSTEWRSHPYITQKILEELPFPTVEEKDIIIIEQITEKVKQIANDNVTINKELDCEIECLIAKLWNLDKGSYKIIFNTIKNVQQLIPFKRLLNFTEKDMSWDIDI